MCGPMEGAQKKPNKRRHLVGLVGASLGMRWTATRANPKLHRYHSHLRGMKAMPPPSPWRCVWSSDRHDAPISNIALVQMSNTKSM